MPASKEAKPAAVPGTAQSASPFPTGGPQRPAGPPPGTAGAATGAARLINPTVRGYMEALSLQRFYGGYVVPTVTDDVYNLGIGEVGNVPLDTDLYSLYRRFLAAQDLHGLATRYGGTMGQRQTNELLAAWINAWLGQERMAPDLVVSMDGGQNAVEVALRALTSPLGSPDSRKQYVLLATPSYPYFSMIVACHAGIQSFLAYDGEGFTRGVEEFCNPGVGAILLNVPHNPMGYALTAEQARRVNRVAAHYDCAIVVDMVYASYAPGVWVGQALAELDPARTVFTDSFSKKYGLPGLRVGFAASAEPELTYALRFVKMAESLSPDSVKLAFAGALLREHGDVPARIAARVRGRHERFLEAFQARPVPGVRVLGERNNPFYLALDISGLLARTGLSDVEVAQACQRGGVRVFPGSFVYPSANLAAQVFTAHGQPAAAGPLPFAPPQVPPGAPIVYSPACASARVPLLRLSFGMEERVTEAAQALTRTLREL
ncbi:MAG TPA: pyridoxal phosphate-dependent aminotransferase [bacterium]|nr:pyridoxal phosphate-dependent aminotransferase [bacterium]